MAKVVAQVIGGQKQDVDGVTKVRDVKKRLNAETYTATLNGNPSADEDVLRDWDFISLAPSVKGAGL